MTNYLPDMDQDATFARTLNGHTSVIFYPILMIEWTKMISSLRLIERCRNQVLLFKTFLPQGLTWVTLGAWTQKQPQNLGTCPGHYFQLIGRNHGFEIFSKYICYPVRKQYVIPAKCVIQMQKYVIQHERMLSSLKKQYSTRKSVVQRENLIYYNANINDIKRINLQAV